MFDSKTNKILLERPLSLYFTTSAISLPRANILMYASLCGSGALPRESGHACRSNCPQMAGHKWHSSGLEMRYAAMESILLLNIFV